MEIILYILTLYLLWSFLFSKLFVNITRHKLFEIRDRVFLEQKHDDEYYRFRNDINLLIRFIQRASWQRIVFDYWFLFKNKARNQQDIKDILNFKNENLNKEFEQALFLIGRLFILRSPTLIILGGILFSIAIIKVGVWNKLKSKTINLIIQDAKNSDIELENIAYGG